MTYKLVFLKKAYKEWDKLSPTIKEQFKNKLKERLIDPKVKTARLSGSAKNLYKIKLRKAGYRLVYQVRDKEVAVAVVAVGKRERNAVYKVALKRMQINSFLVAVVADSEGTEMVLDKA